MRIVRNMPEESSSHTNIMEQMDDRQTLAFISTVELPSKFNKMLNMWINDKTRIDQYYQIYRFCNLPRPELDLKVPDAGYSSLYHYHSCSAKDRAGNLIPRVTRSVKLFCSPFDQSGKNNQPGTRQDTPRKQT